MSEASIVLSAVDNTRAAFQSVKGSMDSIGTSAGALQGTLAGLAASLGVVALANIVKDTVAADRALHDLSIQTGATVEALSGLAAAGKATGTSADDVAGMMTKLARNMASATEEGKGAGKAIEAIGLNLSDFQRLKPEEQMLSVARAMEKFADGNGKSAVASALWGKEGAKNLAYMKDLAQAGGLTAKTTSEQAAAARQLTDNMTKLSTSGASWKKELSHGMTPALNEAAQAFLDITNGTGGLRDEVRKLGKDGTLAEWTRNAVIGISYVMDAVAYLWRTLKVMGEGWGATFAALGAGLGGVVQAVQRALSGDFAGAWEALKRGGRESLAVVGEFGSKVTDIFGEATLGQRLRGRMAELKGMTAAAVQARDQVDFANKGDKADAKGKADPQDKAYSDLVANIREKIAANLAEADAGKALTDQQKVALEINKMFEKGQISAEDATSGLTASLLEDLDASDKASEAAKAFTKSMAEAADAMGKLMDERGKARDKAADDVQAQQEENDALALGAGGLLQLAAARLEDKAASLERRASLVDDIDLSGQLGQAYRDEAAKLRELAKLKIDGGAIKASIDNFKSVWESVDRTAQDVFTNIFEGGKDAFTKLRDTLKATLLALLYQMTMKPFILNIVANATGTPLATAQAASGMGGGGMGMLGNMAGMVSGSGALGAGLMTGLSSWGGGLAGVGGALEAGAGLIGGGSIAGGLGMLAGALGPVAIALGAIAMFAKGGGGPKTEAGYSPGGLSVAGVDIGGSMQGSQRGDVPAAQKISEGISASYAALAEKLGILGKKIDVGIFYSMDNAKGGTSLTQLQVTSSSGYNRGGRTGGIENVARGEDALQSALAEETVRLLIDGLKGSDLAQQFKDILNGISADAGVGDMQAALARVTQARTEQMTLEEQLFQLTATDAQKLTRIREKERAAVDPLNAALLDQVYAQQDLKTATDAATAAANAAADQARAVASEKAGLEKQIMQLTGDTAGLRKLELAALDESNRSLQERIYQLQDEAAASKDAMAAAYAASDAWYNAQLDVYRAMEAKRQADQKAMFDSGKGISDFLRQLITGRAGTASPEQLLASTRSNYIADLTSARLGDVDASGRITGSAQSYIEAQKGVTASGTMTQAVIGQVISELQAMPQVQSYESQVASNTAAMAAKIGQLVDLTVAQAAHIARLLEVTAATSSQSLPQQAEIAANTANMVRAAALVAAEAPV